MSESANQRHPPDRTVRSRCETIHVHPARNGATRIVTRIPHDLVRTRLTISIDECANKPAIYIVNGQTNRTSFGDTEA